MQYHGPTDQFTVSQKSLEAATHDFMYAIAQIRKTNNLPLTPYKKDIGLESHDHIMKGIVDGAKKLGINLGGNWGNEIDVSKFA